jgi:hypothetical protein
MYTQQQLKDFVNSLSSISIPSVQLQGSLPPSVAVFAQEGLSVVLLLKRLYQW